ncbi:MAG: hypothetical protein AB7F89_14615 [Pirellulaceae bacterium]
MAALWRRVPPGGGHQLEEYSEGQPTFRFRETSRNGATVVLLDASRNVTVALHPGGAVISQQGREMFKLSGGWHRLEWTKADRRGSFTEIGPKRWAEFQDGRPVFQFNETSHTGGQVILHDPGRDVLVRLEGPKVKASWKTNRREDARGANHVSGANGSTWSNLDEPGRQ